MYAFVRKRNLRHFRFCEKLLFSSLSNIDHIFNLTLNFNKRYIVFVGKSHSTIRAGRRLFSDGEVIQHGADFTGREIMLVIDGFG